MPFLHCISSFEGTSYKKLYKIATRSFFSCVFISFYIGRYHFSQFFRTSFNFNRFTHPPPLVVEQQHNELPKPHIQLRLDYLNLTYIQKFAILCIATIYTSSVGRVINLKTYVVCFTFYILLYV